MKVSRLAVKCPCGEYAQPVIMYVTEEFQLMTEGLCLSCGEKVVSGVTLVALHAMAKELILPKPIKPLMRKRNLPPTVDDSLFLKQMGVKYADS